MESLVDDGGVGLSTKTNKKSLVPKVPNNPPLSSCSTSRSQPLKQMTTVMEFCPGGDHSLKQKQLGKFFPEFYAADVFLALDYLYMLRIIFRVLKPENILVLEAKISFPFCLPLHDVV
ncbi:unnamed protein product [Linum tenue]|uniref:non-specific serine/threonine protein kinase n=1 Tax=Linum tenue TaxID=586396 RepID=A0AAV0N6Q8_9ROSI|nr:unnamed protein product [Linum tenue]